MVNYAQLVEVIIIYYHLARAANALIKNNNLFFFNYLFIGKWIPKWLLGPSLSVFFFNKYIFHHVTSPYYLYHVVFKVTTYVQ